LSVCLAAGFVAVAPVAGAAGAPDRDSLILVNPEPGWTEMPAAAVLPFVSGLERADTNALQGESVEIAAEVWRSPNGGQVLAIMISRWPSDIDGLEEAAHTIVNEECESSTGNYPGSLAALAGIAGSMAGTCSPSGTGNSLAVAAATSGTDIELIEDIGIGTQPIALGEVEALASRQYRLLPTPPWSPGPAIGGAFGLMVVLSLLIFLVARRRLRRIPMAGVVGAGAGPGEDRRPPGSETASMGLEVGPQAGVASSSGQGVAHAPAQGLAPPDAAFGPREQGRCGLRTRPRGRHGAVG